MKRAGAEAIETTPVVPNEPDLPPAAALHLIRYATDDVEWQPLDEMLPRQ